MPPRDRSDLVPGTLDLLILKTLTLGSLHGYGIAQHIERLSDEVLQLEQGSLYPTLERPQRQGWVTSEWKESPTKRRAVLHDDCRRRTAIRTRTRAL